MFLKVVWLLLAALLFAGCAPVVLDASQGAERVSIPTMALPAERPPYRVEYTRKPEEGPFSRKSGGGWLLWGIVPLNHPNPALLREEMPKGTLPANEVLRVRLPWYGYLGSLVTLGVWVPAEFEYLADPVLVHWEQEE